MVVELALAGRTVQYIADRSDCSISTFRRIRKRYREKGRWQRLPGSGRLKKTTARDERYLRRPVKRIRFRSLTQDTQEYVTHIRHPVSKRTVQRRLYEETIHSRVAVQKPDISLKNRLRRRRWCVRRLNWTLPDNWPCLLFSDESRFNLAYCDGRVRVSSKVGEKSVFECLRMVNRNEMVSLIVCGVIGYHGVGNLVILDENVNADNYVRTWSENLLDSIENIFGDRNHPFVLQHDNAPAHTARRTVAWMEQ